MACTLQIQTFVYNSETNKREAQYVPLGLVEESEPVSMEEVVKRFMQLSEEDRKDAVTKLTKTRQQTLTAKMIGEHQFIGNTTVKDLLTLYQLDGMFKITPELYDSYNIIRGPLFKIGNKNYNGRVLAADGQELFIIKDKYAAITFLKYLQAKEQIAKAASENFSSEAIQPYIADLDIIAKHKKMSKEDVLYEFLNNKDSFQPFHDNGKTYTPIQILGNLISKLTSEYDPVSDYTDLESAIKEASDTSNYEWKISKAKLYNLLKLYYPELEEQLSLENFRNMSDAELQALLTGPQGKFYGHPTLSRAIVSKTTQGKKTVTNPKEPTRKLTAVVPKKTLESLWEIIKTQAKENGIDLPEKFSAYAKENPESIEKFFNTAQFSLEINGDNRVIKAKLNTDKNGNKKVQYYYEYEIKNEPKVTETQSYVTFSFPYTTIGQIYQFGYNTQYIFSPVNDVKLDERGKYKGFYIYKATLPNHKEVYAASRNIISPNTHMATYPTLEAAMHYVDTKYNKALISDNALITIKQQRQIPRSVEIELEDINEGQILTTINVDLPRIKPAQLPPSLRQLLSLTVPQFQKMFGPLSNISKINTPEKAAAFVMLSTKLIASDSLSEKSKVTDVAGILMDSNHIQETIKLIDDIDSKSTRSYYIEKLITTKNKSKIATLKLLDNNGTSVNLEGTSVGDITINEFIGQSVDEAIQFFNNQYGLNVHNVTSSEVLKLSADNNLGLENKIAGIKAFIYDGEIYINTTNATGADLYHESAHIFLGILKAKYPEGYQKIIDDYSKRRGFYKKYSYMKTAYPNFSQPDVLEETVVDMIADSIFSDGQMATGFSDARFTELMQNVLNTVDSFKQDMIDSGLGFNGFIKTLLDQNTSQLRRQRVLTNFVRKMIEDKKISEINCK